jgi:hypothetical protein
VPSDEDLARLSLVIERQRRELAELRATADTASVIAMARGALIERSGCTAAEACTQLSDMATAAGLPDAEMAAAVLHMVSGPAGPVAGPDGLPGSGATPDPGTPDGPQPPEPWPLRSLLAVAAADRAREGDELVGALAEHVMAPLGAAALAVWTLNPDGVLEMLGQRGCDGMDASQWRSLPPRFDCAPQRVVQDAADIWWPAGPPPGDPVVTARGWPRDAARASLALRHRGGAPFGVLQVWWPGPFPAFPGELMAMLTDLAAGLADVLSARLASGGLAPWQGRSPVLGLLDKIATSVLVVHPVRDEAGRVTDFAFSHLSPGYIDPAGHDPAELAGLSLLEVYPASVATGLFAMAAQVLQTGEPLHVPGAAGPLGGPEQTRVEVADVRAAPFFGGVIFTWREYTEAARVVDVLGHAQRLGRLGAWTESLPSGTALWTSSAFAVFGLDPRRAVPIPTAELHNFVLARDRELVQRFREQLLQHAEPATAVIRVVRPDDGAIRQIKVFAEPVQVGGVVTALHGAFQDVSALYHTEVALDATRTQLVDTEQRAAQEHQLAMRLQQAIMPPDARQPAAAGVDLAVRYRPVGQGRLVGGDWYDTVLLPGKELLLVVGDITGHGLDAVTGMVAARNALRGLAATGLGPGGLLEHLNNAACHITEGIAGTVICARYEPDSRVLRWARAGHLPPILVRDGSAAQLPLPDGVLLGLDPGAQYEECVTQLDPGDMVLLFTDGLIERRGESITDSLDGFVAAAAPAAPDADAQADRMLANGQSDTGDDACLVVVQVL